MWGDTTADGVDDARAEVLTPQGEALHEHRITNLVFVRRTVDTTDAPLGPDIGGVYNIVDTWLSTKIMSVVLTVVRQSVAVPWIVVGCYTTTPAEVGERTDNQLDRGGRLDIEAVLVALGTAANVSGGADALYDRSDNDTYGAYLGGTVFERVRVWGTTGGDRTDGFGRNLFDEHFGVAIFPSGGIHVYSRDGVGPALDSWN